MSVAGATRLIRRYLLGEQGAAEELFGNRDIEKELHKLATAALKKDARLGLSPAEVISELFVHLDPKLRRGTYSFENQRKFYAFVMVCMSRVLISLARKRTLPPSRITSLSGVNLAAPGTDPVDTILLVTVLERLEKIAPDDAHAMSRRLLTDATIAEIARELNEDETKTRRRLQRAALQIGKWLKSPESPAV